MTDAAKIQRFITMIAIAFFAIDMMMIQLYPQPIHRQNLKSNSTDQEANETSDNNSISSTDDTGSLNTTDTNDNINITSDNTQENDSSNDAIPVDASHQKTHFIRILYDSSSGLQRQYEKFSSEMITKYPFLVFSGEEYPLPIEKKLLSYCFMAVQYGIIAIMIAGDAIFAKLGIAPPALYVKLKEKKMMVIMMLFFLGNNFSSSFTRTGAYEVEFDESLIYSTTRGDRHLASRELEETIINLVNSN